LAFKSCAIVDSGTAFARMPPKPRTNWRDSLAGPARQLADNIKASRMFRCRVLDDARAGK
jgi:hypothetical protein